MKVAHCNLQNQNKTTLHNRTAGKYIKLSTQTDLIKLSREMEFVDAIGI